VNRIELAMGHVKWEGLVFPGLDLWDQITVKTGCFISVFFKLVP
jgi:hypothetical protein